MGARLQGEGGAKEIETGSICVVGLKSTSVPTFRTALEWESGEKIPNETEGEMYCRNCGKEVDVKAVACPSCGVPPKLEKKFCFNCGTATDPHQVICIKCGTGLTAAGAPGGKSKIAAGLLGIFLGWLGIHKFYLGCSKEGLTMLLISILGGAVTLGVAAWVMGLIGLIEGIIYLTKSDEEFSSQYVQNKKGWF